MSKIYDKYKELKEKDKDKYYIFKVGNFYIFIDEDANNICNYLPLKITNLNKDIVKCGFPLNSKDKYININIINKLKKININNITPLEALNILNKLKESIDG